MFNSTCNKIRIGPGNSNFSPKMLEALDNPILTHRHFFTGVLDEVREGIRYLFQTNTIYSLAMSFTCEGTMELIMDNLLEPEDTILIAVNGLWGERAFSIASRYANVKKIEVEYGNNFTLKQLEEAVSNYKPSVLFIIQGESSTGVYQPIEGLGEICHRYNCLLVVDATSTVGTVPIFFDRLEIDVMYTGPEKVLGSPSGLSPIVLSELAYNRVKSRKIPPKVLYWDLQLIADFWCGFGPYRFTICSTLTNSLREALAFFGEEGLENSITKHERCAKKLWKGLEQLGIELFVKDESKRLPGVTTFKIPLNVDWEIVLKHLSKFEFSGNLLAKKNEIFHVSFMGYDATEENVELFLNSLKNGLKLAEKVN